jgi:hypothetical protein
MADKQTLPPEAGRMDSADIVKNQDSGPSLAQKIDQVDDPAHGYADPAADEDPRTSNVGITSVGASDLNADVPEAPPEEVPGVRRANDTSAKVVGNSRD